MGTPLNNKASGERQPEFPSRFKLHERTRKHHDRNLRVTAPTSTRQHNETRHYINILNKPNVRNSQFKTVVCIGAAARQRGPRAKTHV